jgi:DNA end-binding protein Ku
MPVLYLLRYEDELRNSNFALSGMKESAVKSEELTLAKQLINSSTSTFDLSSYKNDYGEAVKKLIDAKRKGKPLPEPETKPAKAQVVNIVDALRNGLASTKKNLKKSKPRRRAA